MACSAYEARIRYFDGNRRELLPTLDMVSGRWTSCRSRRPRCRVHLEEHPSRDAHRANAAWVWKERSVGFHDRLGLVRHVPADLDPVLEFVGLVRLVVDLEPSTMKASREP